MKALSEQQGDQELGTKHRSVEHSYNHTKTSFQL